MSTIPADPSMVLGQVVYPDKLKTLQEIGAILEPQKDAREKLNSLMLSNYNLKSVMSELVNMGMSVGPLQKEIDSLKKKTAKAALDLAQKTIDCQTKVAEKKVEKKQSTISYSVESPFDMSQVQVQGKEFAMDSVNFDVQFFRNEENSDKSTSEQISKYIQDTLTGWNQNGSSQGMAHDSEKAVSKQVKEHKIEGTMVIVANCTHKKANFLTGPLDAQRTLDAWNSLYPDDYLQANPASMAKAALATSSGENAIQVLSGATYGSTFVGLVHILEKESSADPKGSGGEIPENVKNAIKNKVNQELMIQDMTGKFGVSDDFAESVKDITSSASINAHCSLICQGCIPDIQVHEHTQVLKQLQPSTNDVMAQIMAIRDSSNDVGGGGGTEGMQAKLGAQFMEMAKSSTEAAAKVEPRKMRVLDMDTLLDAFANYLSFARGGTGGDGPGGGIPINFYLKRIDKATVAKTYIKAFYASGLDKKEEKKE